MLSRDDRTGCGGFTSELSAFVVQAAAARVEEILAERSSVRLSREAAVAFGEALDRPAEVNDRLAKTLRRKRKFSWLD